MSNAEPIQSIVAVIHDEQPAKSEVWKIPVSEFEGTEYPTREEAARGAERLCANRGIPFVDPVRERG